MPRYLIRNIGMFFMKDKEKVRMKSFVHFLDRLIQFSSPCDENGGSKLNSSNHSINCLKTAIKHYKNNNSNRQQVPPRF